MKIESYTFGKIKIDGKTFTSDVIIYHGRVNSSWWRKEGHLLQLDDLSEAIKESPDVLIVGKGYSGLMKVPEVTSKALSEKGITVYSEKTSDAVELYNKLNHVGKVIAALHLTC